jgi:hypothetical protein
MGKAHKQAPKRNAAQEIRHKLRGIDRLLNNVG